MVRCLSMPFGVNAPYQSEEDEIIYYAEVYQSDIVPQSKQIDKDGKKLREYQKKLANLKID